MKKIILFTITALTMGCSTPKQTVNPPTKAPEMKSNFALALHGGAGNIAKRKLTPEQEEAYKVVLQEAINKGYTLLNDGKDAVTVVEEVIKILEDSPLFNAGRGAVFSHEGHNQMDAAIMNGANLDAGAICNVRHIKNPITAARKVMEKSKFVFLSDQGAEEFAKENNVELVDTSYFFYQPRWDEYQKIKESKATKLDNDSQGENSTEPFNNSIDKFGTVGCVALDRFGNLAAGTSTGGIVNKQYNRIGDSPIIGAGTYANNATCAVSCTGHGEDFIKLVLAHDISALMQYKNLPLQEAVKIALEKLVAIKGRGGLIAIDAQGNIIMDMTTSGMFRASANQKGIQKVAIYKE